MNKCIITGRLVKKPELRATKNGKAVCDFTLAVNRPTYRDEENETDFLDFEVYGSQAENLCKYQDKGNMIAVFGENRKDTWKDNEDNYKSRNYILVSNIEYLESKKNTTIEKTKITDEPFKEFGEQIEIDAEEDLPF